MRGDWLEISCEETIENLFKGINAQFSAPSIQKTNVKEVGGVGIQMVWAIVPNTGDKGIRFIGSSRDCINGVVGIDQQIDDEVEGDDNKI